MKSIRNSVKVVRSLGLIMLMVILGGAVNYTAAQSHVTMATANCTATSTYIEFDVTVVNDGTTTLAFNSTTLRIALPSTIINNTDACTVSYQGSSDFPLLFTSGNNQSYTPSSRLITATTSPTQYTSATAVSLPAGTARTIGRYRVTKSSGTFTENGSGAMVWNSTAGVVLYVNGASTTTNFNTTTNRTLSTPCTLTIPSSCVVPSLSAVTSNVTCNGGTDGSINLSTSGGSSPFTYAWTKTGDGGFSATTEDITGLTAGTYNVTVTASGGCTTGNSYTITEPAALSPIITTASACDSYTWSVNGQTYTSSGTYNTTVGCQPYTLNLTISTGIGWGNLQFPGSANIACGGNLTAYGQVYKSGITEAAGQGAGIIAEIGYSTTNTDPSTWTNWSPASFNVQAGNNDEYTGTLSGLAPGTYYYTFRYKYGSCDYQYGGYDALGGGIWNGTQYVSGVLTIASGTTNTTNASACDSYTWSVNGTTYTSSGTYTYTSGCNTEVLNLTITASTSNTTNASACDSYTWSVNGQTYTSSGTYTSTSGCHTEVLNLTITASTSNTTNASACDSYTWSVNGQTYTSSGTYTSTSGCHTEVLNLTITASTSNTTNASACDSYTWSVNGQTYTSSGTYTSTSGCHTEVLNLTITASTSNTTNASACDSYTWSVNGQTYTSSGTYTSTSGCHTEVLNLTITASTSNTTTASACDSYTWSVNGQTYTSSGTYTSTSGCHTEVLNLTITASTSNTTNASACDSYTWSVNGQTYTSSGTYTSTSGCHTEVLNLTITSSTSNTTNASACDSYTWSVNSVTYTSSGTYTYTSGCHTEVLNLTITASTNNTTTASACNSYTWSVNGVTYTSSGTYTYTSGCHTEVLNLTITTGLAPGTPGIIQGQRFNLCNSPAQTYTLANPAQRATSYTWSVPAGYSILSGQGTTSIVLQLPANPVQDTISVAGNNACGTGPKRIIVLRAKPSQPIISGPACVTANQSGLVYTVTNPEPGVSYIWKVPGQARITNGQGTTSVTVDWKSTSGTISCMPNNTCATGARGSYSVTVGCASAVAVNASAVKMIVYPNPTFGLTNVIFTVSKETKYALVVTDMAGKRLQQKELVALPGQNKVTLDLSKYTSGIYTVNLISPDGIETVKVVKGE